jgi:hypothetical protein
MRSRIIPHSSWPCFLVHLLDPFQNPVQYTQQAFHLGRLNQLSQGNAGILPCRIHVEANLILELKSLHCLTSRP